MQLHALPSLDQLVEQHPQLTGLQQELAEAGRCVHACVHDGLHVAEAGRCVHVCVLNGLHAAETGRCVHACVHDGIHVAALPWGGPQPGTWA